MHLPVSFSEAGVTSVQKTEEHPASFSEAGVTNVQKNEEHCKALLQRHHFHIFSCTHLSLATKSPKKTYEEYYFLHIRVLPFPAAVLSYILRLFSNPQ